MLALSWSGGKDSALALHALRCEQGVTPGALLTTITEDFGRVSMHGVRRELVRAQSDAAGVPLVEVEIPAGCPNHVYEARMARALATPPLDRADTIAFADLPDGVDPCGEHGEFHTFVHAGPFLARPIAVARGELVTRDGFVFCDLLPA